MNLAYLFYVVLANDESTEYRVNVRLVSNAIVFIGAKCMV